MIPDRFVSLVAAARVARLQAFAPYSKFQVGAALQVEDGPMVIGCNVESASYGLTMCAERVALFTAITHGHRRFTRVAIVTHTNDLTPPCGACRQLLWEFAPDAEVILANLSSKFLRFTVRELLPNAFDAKQLGS